MTRTNRKGAKHGACAIAMQRMFPKVYKEWIEKNPQALNLINPPPKIQNPTDKQPKKKKEKASKI